MISVNFLTSLMTWQTSAVWCIVQTHRHTSPTTRTGSRRRSMFCFGARPSRLENKPLLSASGTKELNDWETFYGGCVI
ncbi:hypothetical protein Z043_106687 [Scleropages formosus]|uniref:Secreted protein n=1 Tax=Scleropages formosus TaxID=113540 RepID=A0A0P7XCV9_SCLFO|nr:hypothetical protein Z043_106687 [Scleropages formosus]